MKRLVILMFALGFTVVIANPVSKQTIKSDNKSSPQPNSDSQTKHEEVINTINKGEKEQKKDTLIQETPQSSDISNENNAVLEVVIEEQAIPNTDEKTLDQNLKQEPSKDESTQTTRIENDVTDKVELVIEEVIKEPIDTNFQPQKGLTEEPTLAVITELVNERPVVETIIENLPSINYPGFESSETAPDFVVPSTGFVGESAQLPSFYGDVPQLPAMIDDKSQIPDFIENIPQLPGFFDNDPKSETDEDNMVLDKEYFQDDMEKVEHEIMETAAGFIPTPLVFRRKQKPRRRFAIRRHFRNNPYRRHQMMNYPYYYPYSYYAYYRPSSLRYY